MGDLRPLEDSVGGVIAQVWGERESIETGRMAGKASCTLTGGAPSLALVPPSQCAGIGFVGGHSVDGGHAVGIE